MSTEPRAAAASVLLPLVLLMLHAAVSHFHSSAFTASAVTLSDPTAFSQWDRDLSFSRQNQLQQLQHQRPWQQRQQQRQQARVDSELQEEMHWARRDKQHFLATRWWALHRYPYQENESNMGEEVRSYFTDYQWRQLSVKSCGFDHKLVRAALQGLAVAITNCQHQMKDERWNCTLIEEHRNGKNIFGHFLWRGTPEVALVQSLVSAGVTWSVARECRSGLACCPCHLSRHKEELLRQQQAAQQQQPQQQQQQPALVHVQADCDHNVRFARSLARRLLDRADAVNSLHGLMMKHNYNTGMRVVRKTMKRSCRCHGPSGSCSYKLCWQQVESFRKVSNWLKNEYYRSVLVQRGHKKRVYTKRRSRKQVFLVSKSDLGNRLPQLTSLVYRERFSKRELCEGSPQFGVTGTRQRVCSEADSGNCNHVCCGRPVRVEHFRHINTKCNCKFVWCCDIKCQTCVTDRKRQICD